MQARRFVTFDSEVAAPGPAAIPQGMKAETLAHDVAVLVFPPRTFRVRPVALPPLRLLDRLRTLLRHEQRFLRPYAQPGAAKTRHESLR